VLIGASQRVDIYRLKLQKQVFSGCIALFDIKMGDIRKRTFEVDRIFLPRCFFKRPVLQVLIIVNNALFDPKKFDIGPE
jgi:hypothetical protein